MFRPPKWAKASWAALVTALTAAGFLGSSSLSGRPVFGTGPSVLYEYGWPSPWLRIVFDKGIVVNGQPQSTGVLPGAIHSFSIEPLAVAVDVTLPLAAGVVVSTLLVCAIAMLTRSARDTDHGE